MWVVRVAHKLLCLPLFLIIYCFDGDNQLLCMSANLRFIYGCQHSLHHNLPVLYNKANLSLLLSVDKYVTSPSLG